MLPQLHGKNSCSSIAVGDIGVVAIFAVDMAFNVGLADTGKGIITVKAVSEKNP